MKKYFVKETDEELEFGDIISISFEKVLENGVVSVDKEIEFTEDVVDFLISLDIIEERGCIHFDDDAPCEKFSLDELEKRISDIEACIREIKLSAIGDLRPLKEILTESKYLRRQG